MKIHPIETYIRIRRFNKNSNKHLVMVCFSTDMYKQDSDIVLYKYARDLIKRIFFSTGCQFSSTIEISNIIHKRDVLIDLEISFVNPKVQFPKESIINLFVLDDSLYDVEIKMKNGSKKLADILVCNIFNNLNVKIDNRKRLSENNNITCTYCVRVLN